MENVVSLVVSMDELQRFSSFVLLPKITRAAAKNLTRKFDTPPESDSVVPSANFCAASFASGC